MARYENAKWHISYHNEDDKKRIEKVMQKTGCDNCSENKTRHDI